MHRQGSASFRFANRRQAGILLSRALNAPFDVFVVRKLGLPGHSELAMGAIASGGVRVLNDDVLRWYQPSQADIERVTKAELSELTRREQAYRGNRPPLVLGGRLSSWSTMG